MWAPVALMLYALNGPTAAVVGDEIHKTKEACEAAIAKAVPAELDAETRTAYEQGYRHFVCIRITGADVFQNAK
ncbi:MAG TPA: hypothetical protein VEZ16_04125 [Microvirga sp.]|nr:hypothetical protein [Microvirga sp.]